MFIYFSPPVLLRFLLSFSLFGLFFMSHQRIFHIHILSSPVEHIRHSLWSFLYRENRNLSFRSPLVNTATSILSFTSSIKKASLLKRVMYDLSMSSSCCLMFIRHIVDFLYLCPPIKCEANWALNFLKVIMELGINLLNQILTRPFNVIGKALHMILSATPCKCIRVLKDSR